MCISMGLFYCIESQTRNTCFVKLCTHTIMISLSNEENAEDKANREDI